MVKFLKVLAALLVLYFGAQWYISGNSESYLRQYLDTFERSSHGAISIEITKFEKGLRSSRAWLKIVLMDPESGRASAAARIKEKSVEVDIEHGPVILRYGTGFGLMKLHSECDLGDGKTPPKEPGTIRALCGALIGFTKKVHESVDIDDIRVSGKGKESDIYVASPRVRGTHPIDSLVGRLSIATDKMIVSSAVRGEKAELSKAVFEADIDEVFPEGLMLGSSRISVDRIDFAMAGAKKVAFSGSLETRLRKKDEKRAEAELIFAFRSLNEEAVGKAYGIKSVDTVISFENLGLEGLEKMARLSSDRTELQVKLARAVKKGDDAQMQRMILEIEDLNKRFIPIYNTLLVRGETKLSIHKKVEAEEVSTLDISLLYTGEKLKGPISSALINLAANADNLFEGDFDMKLSSRLLGRIDPRAAVLMKRLKEKNIIRRDGVFYILKGRVEKGRIEINGVSYSPQQLMVLLMM